MTADERLRQAELAAERADLVLEQFAQRLDELHSHPIGQAADIVVALDRRRRAARKRYALDHVGIEGALGQKLDRPPAVACDPPRFGVEDVDEKLADRLAFGFRLVDAGERLQESAAASTWTSGMLKWPRKTLTTSSASPCLRRP